RAEAHDGTPKRATKYPLPIVERAQTPRAMREVRRRATRKPAPVAQREPHLHRLLPVLDLAILHVPARIQVFEPADVAHRLRRALDRRAHGVINAFGGGTGQLGRLVDVVAHGSAPSEWTASLPPRGGDVNHREGVLSDRGVPASNGSVRGPGQGSPNPRLNCMPATGAGPTSSVSPTSTGSPCGGVRVPSSGCDASSARARCRCQALYATRPRAPAAINLTMGMGFSGCVADAENAPALVIRA